MRKNKSMKKVFSYIILILCCLCTACSCGKDASISYAHKSITVNMGDVYEIDDKDVEILYSTRKYTVSILDDSVAQVDGLKVIPKKKGSTKIRFDLTEKDGVYCEITLIVTNNIFAKSVSVDNKNVKIDINENMIAYNKLILNQGCNEIPRVTYDSNVITYDYKTGRILALKEGETSVVVMYGACNVSFNVVVVGDVYVKLIEIDDYEIYKSSAGKFEYNIFPSTANMYEFECNSSILEVNKDGSYYAVETGETVVNIKYKTSSEGKYSYKAFNVKVVEKIETFDLNITNIEDDNCSYYFVENMYRITVSNIKNLKFENLAFSSNIIVENYQFVGKKLCIDFYFKNVGENILKVDIDLGGELQLSQSVNVLVSSYEHIVVKAKWFVNSQLPLSDGKYHLYIGSPTLPTYLTFALEINGVMVQEDYKIYNVSTGTRIEVSGKFEPTIAGEYRLEFVLNDDVVKTIYVVVS